MKNAGLLVLLSSTVALLSSACEEVDSLLMRQGSPSDSTVVDSTMADTIHTDSTDTDSVSMDTTAADTIHYDSTDSIGVDSARTLGQAQISEPVIFRNVLVADRTVCTIDRTAYCYQESHSAVEYEEWITTA